MITPIQDPTEWCAGMVVVPKPDGKVRICVDLTKLNENICRELHPLPIVEQTLAQISGAQIFSKLDANSGFWQVPLSRESALLTSFITPFGRYYFNRLPFGITSAPEHFQRRMTAMLGNMEGTVCLMDDILVYGKTKEEHDQRLYTVLDRLQASGITLNKKKCVFGKTEVKFLGQILNASGVQSDPEKIKAIKEMKDPTNVSEVRRVLGMANQLSKFIPNLADISKPLRNLLAKDKSWCWDHTQRQAFANIKEALMRRPVLSLFDPTQAITVSADASSFGLGAVLLQKKPGEDSRPVAYISCSMIPTEQ